MFAISMIDLTCTTCDLQFDIPVAVCKTTDVEHTIGNRVYRDIDTRTGLSVEKLHVTAWCPRCKTRITIC